MDYDTIAVIHRKNKVISIFLKEGSVLSFDNIVDVIIDELNQINKESEQI